MTLEMRGKHSAYDADHGGDVALRIRSVEDRHEAAAQVTKHLVCAHANDLIFFALPVFDGAAFDAYELSKGILIREEHLYELLIDDDNVLGAFGIFGTEVASR